MTYSSVYSTCSLVYWRIRVQSDIPLHSRIRCCYSIVQREHQRRLHSERTATLRKPNNLRTLITIVILIFSRASVDIAIWTITVSTQLSRWMLIGLRCDQSIPLLNVTCRRGAWLSHSTSQFRTAHAPRLT